MRVNDMAGCNKVSTSSSSASLALGVAVIVAAAVAVASLDGADAAAMDFGNSAGKSRQTQTLYLTTRSRTYLMPITYMVLIVMVI